MNEKKTWDKPCDPIASGKYPARAQSARYQFIQLHDGTELECIKVKFKLDTGETIEWPAWFGYDDKKNKKSLKALGHCGWTGTDPQDTTGIDSNRVQLVITNEDRDGNPLENPRVLYVNELNFKKPASAVSPEDRSTVLARKIKALRGESTPALDAMSDDDVPF